MQMSHYILLNLLADNIPCAVEFVLSQLRET